MKAQVVFEHVLIFTLSIAIFLTTYTYVYSYKNFFSDSVFYYYVSSILDNIVISSHKLFRMDGNISIIVNIPKRVENRVYKIEGTGDGIKLTSGEIILERKTGFEILGDISSSRGRIVIYKKGNKILIR